MQGHNVKTMKAIRLQVAIVLLLASNRRGPARVGLWGVGGSGIEDILGDV